MLCSSHGKGRRSQSGVFTAHKEMLENKKEGRGHNWKASEPEGLSSLCMSPVFLHSPAWTRDLSEEEVKAQGRQGKEHKRHAWDLCCAAATAAVRQCSCSAPGSRPARITAASAICARSAGVPSPAQHPRHLTPRLGASAQARCSSSVCYSSCMIGFLCHNCLITSVQYGTSKVVLRRITPEGGANLI